MLLGLFSLLESRPQMDDCSMNEDTISETGIHMLSVPHLQSTAVVHAGRAEIELSCSCGIDGQIHFYNNPDVLIVISCDTTHFNHKVMLTND